MNHTSLWTCDLVLGGVEYTQPQLISVLSTVPMSDASLILADQLMTTLLNQTAGGDVSSVAQTIADAQAWLAANKDADGLLPYGVAPSSAAGQVAVALAATLDSFNNSCE